jgi:nucleoside-diphosphate-sugar epimerase
MKRILVNGNMGYIGPVVVKHFRRNYPGIEIIGFDSGFFAGCLANPNVFPESNVDVQYFGDIRNFPEYILKDVDTVIQLAAVSNDPMGKSFEIPTNEINNKSAVEIAKLSKKMGVKNFVFASSCSVYGAAGDEAKNENSDLNPQTAYAKSKIQCEIGLRGLADDDFIITALRFATACGFSPRLRLDLVLNDFVVSGFLSGRIEILSDGSPLRPLIHVKDMARAIEWASIRNSNQGGYFLIINAGSNTWNYRIGELAEKVRDILGNIELSVNTNAASDTRSYKVDFSLFHNLAPGHTPEMTIDEAVIDLLEGVKTMHFHGKNFRNSNYIRLEVLNHLINTNRINNNLEWLKSK